MKATLTPRRTHASRILREQAIAAGIDPFVAGTTAPDDLAAVIHMAPRLRLVRDVDATPASDVDVLTFALGSAFVETTYHFPGGDAA